MNTVIAIRVDASPLIGLGHLQRCLSLAHALRDAGAEVVFICRALGLDLGPRVQAAGFGLRLLAMPGDADSPKTDNADDTAHHTQPAHAAWLGVHWQRDASDTLAALQDLRPQWMVVDHYGIAASWHQAVAAASGARIAVVDDLADRPLAATLLIDHNLAAPDHRHKYQACIGADTVLLGGPRFALLGPAYATAPRHRFHAQVRSIGIFMGGADAANLSALALLACREQAGFDGAIEIVTTGANPHLAALQALAAQWPGTQLTLDQPDLAAFFARHDLQIGAGGGATWERCCIGAPSLLLQAAPNQRAVLPLLQARGAVATLPAGAPLDRAALAAQLQALLATPGLRRSLSERAQGLVDGRGAQRAALRMLAPGAVTTRQAAPADRDLLLAWRNHAATRAASRNDAPIAPADHARWFDRVLADPQRLLLVGQMGRIDIGCVRFDADAAGRAEVSIYLDPALIGLGLGTCLLLAAEAQWRAMHAHSVQFVATVLPHNPASARLFAACGYQHDGNGLWCKTAARDDGATP